MVDPWHALGDAGIEEQGQIGEKRWWARPGTEAPPLGGTVGVAQRGPGLHYRCSLFLVVGLGGGGSDSCPAALPSEDVIHWELSGPGG